ncbi:MAG: HAMP domain-containing histidine kinase [Lachnospiraceae bacterium]|nr:HAMP domain-containing histidine kinase [Lachnospiraceae bacterium]
MKKLTIRIRMTLWFSIIIILIVILTYGVIFSVSNAIMQKSIRDNLIEAIENNIDEVEYYSSGGEIDYDGDADLYIVFGDGFLEIDDDYLDEVNGIFTALYNDDGVMLYGANPISRDIKDITFTDKEIRKDTVRGTTWYLYDRKLEGENLDGLWLRGVVSVDSQPFQLSSVFHLLMLLLPLLLLLGIVGAYFIAGRSLAPAKQIVETVSQINQGQDLKKRIALGEGEDEFHQLANAFDAMFDRLEASFDRERQFVSDASHELRTPMAVIMAQCEYSMSKEGLDDEYMEALAVIKRQGGKMTRLINDMLMVTRMESVEGYEMEPLDFSSLTVTVCEDLSLIADKNITLTCQVEPGVYVNGNRELLSRLLSNLISNAYRYGRENGHIRVVLESEDRLVRLSVEDDGIGIAEEEQEKIFGRFYQVGAARTDDGLGLGLSMVSKIARLHQGIVKVKSIPDEGSCFFLEMEKQLLKNGKKEENKKF